MKKDKTHNKSTFMSIPSFKMVAANTFLFKDSLASGVFPCADPEGFVRGFQFWQRFF